MDTHEVSGHDLGQIERLLRDLGVTAAQSGGIGMSSGQLIATLESTLLLMSLTPANLQPRADWNNPEGRGQSVYALIPVITTELPRPVAREMAQRVVAQLTDARIITIGQLTALHENHLKGTLGPMAIRIVEAALALRNLALMPVPARLPG